MRIFGSERMEQMLVKLGLQEGEAIVHPWINKALEKAQHKVEARNFDIRKNILKFDNVMNDQRKVIFERRREIMAEESVEETVDRDARRRRRIRSSPAYSAERLRRGVGRRGARGRGAMRSSISICRSSIGRRKKASPTRRSRSACSTAANEFYAARVERNTVAALAHDREAGRAAGARSRCGANISSCSTICGRSSAGAAWRSAIRSTNTSPRRWSCSSSLMEHWDEAVTAQLMRVEVILRAAAAANCRRWSCRIPIPAPDCGRRRRRTGCARHDQRPARRAGLRRSRNRTGSRSGTRSASPRDLGQDRPQ